jgi:hypothetical protein
VGFEAMKPISRRSLIASLAALAVAFGLLHPTAASAQSDPLASWNDGPAKQAIVSFVKATTDQSSRDFIRGLQPHHCLEAFLHVDADP